MKKSLLLIVYFLVAISIPSFGIEKVVSVTTAGTLSESISEEEKYTITSLTVTGQINGVDLQLLREMAGNDYHGFVTDGSLSYLDLSGATIVAGGNYLELTDGKLYYNIERTSYYSGYSTDPLSSQDNVLGYLVFAGCNKLETIKLPAGLVTIGTMAFHKTSLKTIVWPTSLTTIGNSAFSDCSFTSFTLPASVQNLDGYIFIGCTSLTELNVASGNTVFDSRDNCNAIIKTSTNELVCGTKTTVIPSSVTSIGQGAFDRLGLTSITIPSNITHIGINAYGWNNITSVTIPASVTSIGNSAFGNCRQLSSVTVEATTPIAIEENVFTNRANAKLLVPVGSMSAYKAADYWKEFGEIIEAKTIHVETAGTLSSFISDEEKLKITGLILTGDLNGTDLRLIREMAGNDYNGFTTDGNLSYLDLSGATIVAGENYIELTEGKVYFNKEKTSYSGEYSTDPLSSQDNVLGDFVFAGCNKLETIKLPAGLVSIGRMAFMSTGLKTVEWPNSLTSIGDAAFSGSRFTSFTLPASVQTLGHNIVANCGSLTELNVEEGNETFGSPDNCNAIIKTSTNELVCGIKTTVIPSTVTSIGDAAFHGLGLTSVTIPNNITQVGDNAYGWNHITSVTIPASVTSMGYAFNGCNDLTTVTVKWTSPIAIVEKTFTNRANAKLIVPVGSMSAYKAADYWKEFGEIVEAKIIHVETAGTLPSFISDEEKLTITRLVLTGDLNGTDLRLIREMAGNDYLGQPTNGSLKILDLSGANIVEGGEKYLDTEYITSSTGITVHNEYEFHFETENNVLGESLFSACDKLEEVILPNSITAIERAVFWYCLNLKSIEIPKNVSSIEGSFVDGRYQFSSITVAEGNQTFNSPEGSNVIMQGTTLVRGCNNTKIPTGTTVIGPYAFLHCNGLGNFTVPDGVTTIMGSAFLYSDLSSINLPSTLTTIGRRTFEDCSQLTSVTIGATTPIAIEEDVFTNRENKTLYVPVGSKATYEAADYWKDFGEIVEAKIIHVETAGTLPSLISDQEKLTITRLVLTGDLNGTDLRLIREMAGNDYNGFTTDGNLSYLDLSGATIVAGGNYLELTEGKVYFNKEKTTYAGEYSTDPLPSQDNVLGDFVFAGCNKLETIKLPAGLVSIGRMAFMSTGLKTVEWPNSLTSIGDAAFSGSRFTSFTLPASVQTLGHNIVANCGSLTELNVEEGNETFGSPDNCNAIIKTSTNELVCGLKTTVIPSTVTSIGDAAFHGLGLTSVTIPSNITHIGDNAYGWNDITSVTIPASVTSMGYAFNGCDNLEAVTVEWVSPIAIVEKTFTNRANATLYVPAGSKAAYEAADYWKDFKEILEGGTESLYAGNVSAYKGTQVVLPILLTNEQTVAGIQFDLQLPSGFSVVKNGEDYLASLTNRASGLSLSVSELTSGDYRFVVVSSEGNKVTGTEGEVMNVTINVPADATIGDNTITMNNVVITAVVGGENTSVYHDNPTSVLTVLDYTVGDVNDDSNINVVDVAAIAAHVAGQTPTGFIEIAADVNTDGVVNSADVTAEVTNALQSVSVGTGTSAGQLLNVNDFVAYKGKNVTLPITLTNSQAISGFQFDLQLPEGVSIAQDGITLADRANGLTFNTSALTTTTTRFVVVATNGSTMAAGEGEVMNLTLTVAANAVSGTVTLNNTVLAVKSGNTLSAVYTTDVEAAMTVRSFILGDVNDDNHINVTDVVCVVDHILGKTPSKFIIFAADINGDNVVNVTDVMGLVDIILKAQGLAATRGEGDENVPVLNDLDLNENDGQLSLSVKDAGNYVASQLEVILSEGQTLEGITLNDAFKQTHQLIFARSGQSTYTVLVFSMGNENYPQNDDELLKLNVSGGSGEIMVDEAIMVTRQQEQKRMAPVSSFKVETGNELMDIYSLDGRLIKSQVKDTQGLSKGVYIINGKKVMVQ